LKNSLINLDMLRCRVDVNEFLAVCDKIRHLKRNGDNDRLLLACRRAIDIYKGEFLHEEPYLSWAETKRVALRDRYLAVLLELAGLCETKGMPEKAARHYSAIIQADPLAEYAHQRLMRLFQRQGRRSAAIKIYKDLTQTLSEELETTPDPATTRLYESIVNGSVSDNLKL
jgi:DNA-binding SARP family transcriptional activator